MWRSMPLYREVHLAALFERSTESMTSSYSEWGISDRPSPIPISAFFKQGESAKSLLIDTPYVELRTVILLTQIVACGQ